MLLLHGGGAGVDMTPEQLAVAKQHADAWATTLGYPASNMTFLQGGQAPPSPLTPLT
jgi:hypothetical protein